MPGRFDRRSPRGCRRPAENPPRSRPPRRHAAQRPAPALPRHRGRMKSAALSGNTGAVQRCGRLASSCQAAVGRASVRARPGHATRDRRTIADRADKAARAPPCPPAAGAMRHQPSSAINRSDSALDRRSRCASRSASSSTQTPSAPRRRTASGFDADRRFDLRPCSRSSRDTARRRARCRAGRLSAITASVGVARGATSSFSNSMRTRSRDSVSSPARAAMQACSPAASGAPSPYQA